MLWLDVGSQEPVQRCVEQIGSSRRPSPSSAAFSVDRYRPASSANRRRSRARRTLATSFSVVIGLLEVQQVFVDMRAQLRRWSCRPRRPSRETGDFQGLHPVHRGLFEAEVPKLQQQRMPDYQSVPGCVRGWPGRTYPVIASAITQVVRENSHALGFPGHRG